MQAISAHLETIESATARLSAASAGLVERAAAARFKVRLGDLWRRTNWPEPAAKARCVAIYVMVTELGLSHEEVAQRFHCTTRSSQRAAQRIAEERDDDAALGGFLDELEDAMRQR